MVQALVGGSSYLGTGTMSLVGESFARVGVTLSQHGAGMTFFNGAGDMELIYVPSFVTQVVRAQLNLGAEVFLGGACVRACVRACASLCVMTACMPACLPACLPTALAWGGSTCPSAPKGDSHICTTDRSLVFSKPPQLAS